MAGLKGFAAVELLRKRSQPQRGGNEKQPDAYDRSQPDALARWQDTYLESLAARNYSAGTLQGRRDALKVFLAWAAERELKQASQITRPILESFQRWLWRYTKPNGQRLGWSTQRNRLGILKDFFRWITRQNVILHNPASELELPRMEKRLPQEALSPAEVAKLLALPDVADPLGVRDRAMLELFYSTGLRRAELCRLELPDLNTERGTIHVRLGKGRNYAKVVVMQRCGAGTLRDQRAGPVELDITTASPGSGGPLRQGGTDTV
jgi:integrase/recombinase XerD